MNNMKKPTKIFKIQDMITVDVYPIGTKVKVTDTGQIFSTWEDAYHLLGFKNKKKNPFPVDSVSVHLSVEWIVAGCAYCTRYGAIYHLKSTGGLYEILIAESGIRPDVETITIEGKEYALREVKERIKQLEPV